jgi:Skp family chaperone for outer membrane proteins
MVFNQEQRTEHPQILDYTGDLSDPLVRKMVERLARAVSDPQVRREMDAEAEVDRAITRLLDEEKQQYQVALQAKDAALQAKDAALQEKDAVLQAKDAVLQAKDAVLQAKEEALQEKDRVIANLKKQLEERDNN